MARIRTIKPEFFTSADICALPPLARLLYVALWCESDREGRLVWNPRTFKIRYLPEDQCDIDQLCSMLIGSGLVVRYDEADQRLAYIPTFIDHQQVNNRETESRLPEPTEDSTRQARDNDASGTRVDASVTPLLRKGKERKGRELSSQTPWPEGASVPDDWISDAEKKKPGVDWRTESERFISHHVAKGSKFANWKSAWWTWVNSPYEKNKSAALAGNSRRELGA